MPILDPFSKKVPLIEKANIKQLVRIPQLMTGLTPSNSRDLVNKSFLDARSLLNLKGMMWGCVPTYISASTVQIGKGVWIDSTGTQAFVISSPFNVDLSSSGAGGLDTGPEASGTHYGIHLVGKTDGTVNAVWSLYSNSTPTLPAGYSYSAKLNYSARNDGSSNLLRTYVSGAWPFAPDIFLTLAENGTYQLLSGGVATSFTALSASSYAPPDCTEVWINLYTKFVSNNVTGYMRPSGSTSGVIVGGGADTAPSSAHMRLQQTDTSQQMDYKMATAGSSMTVEMAGWRMPIWAPPV